MLNKWITWWITWYGHTRKKIDFLDPDEAVKLGDTTGKSWADEDVEHVDGCSWNSVLIRGVGTKVGVGGQPAMASAVVRTYNGGLGAELPAEVQGAVPPVGSERWSPLKLRNFFHLHLQQKGKFVIFSVYFQYIARASMDWLFSAQWRSHLALLARPASLVCLSVARKSEFYLCQFCDK